MQREGSGANDNVFVAIGQTTSQIGRNRLLSMIDDIRGCFMKRMPVQRRSMRDGEADERMSPPL